MYEMHWEKNAACLPDSVKQLFHFWSVYVPFMWWGPKPVTQEIWGPGVTYVPNNVRTGFYAVSLDAGLYETHCSIKAPTPLPSDKADLCNKESLDTIRL